MRSGQAWVLIVALVIAGGAPYRVVAKRPASDPAARCAARKLAASGGTVLADLRCHGKAAAKGSTVEDSCLAGPRRRLTKAFGRAERTGSCGSTGDAGAVAGGLEQRAHDLADLLRPFDARSKCAAKQLRALGVAANKLYRARAKFAVDGEQAKLDAARVTARGRVERAFAKAARTGGCVPLEAPTTPGSLTERAGGTSGPMQVRIEAVKRIRIAPAGRGEILAKRAAAEAAGFTVADDGSVLTGTSVPASGWLVTLGSGRGRSDVAGIATLDVPVDAPAAGQIFQGASDTFVVGPVFRDELRPVGEALQTITFEITNDGPCGMNENPADDSAQCHAAPAAANRVRTPRPAEPVAGESQLNPDPMLFPPLITTEFGTYPNPDPAAEQIACLDYNGYIESHTDRGESSETGIISYPGSTCNIQVQLGCCENEAADIGRQVASVVSPERFPVMACVANHKGRFCQSVTRGDVAIEVKGDIIKAGQAKEYEVSAGERVPIVVHNNGCYGDTRVNEGILASVLTLGGRIVDGALGRLTGGVIHHQADSGDYFPDRDVAYQAPDPCPDDAFARFRRDRYRFETDGWAAGVAFKCPPTTTTTLVCAAPGVPGRFTSEGASCAGWSGTFRWVYTTDEVYSFSDATGFFSKDNHLRIEGTWSIVGTAAAMPGDESDTVDTTWTATYSLTKTEAEHRDFCVGQVSDTTATVLGSGTGAQQLLISPYGDTNQVTIALAGSSNDFPLAGSSTNQFCDGRSVTTPSSGTAENEAGSLVNGLPILVPDPGDPGHYAGRLTVSHWEEPRSGGSFVLDSFVEWDIRRR